MFHKTFKIKSENVLKSSERKRIKSEIQKQFPLLNTEILSELIPQKSDMQLAKVYTHSGEAVSILLLSRQPIFFESDGIFYPTVYSTWMYPDMFPTLTTWPLVIPKIMGGADLMLPGVRLPSEVTELSFVDIHDGLACCVCAAGNRACLAVGKACMSGADMVKCGMRGKGVLVKHFYGDHLWALGNRSHPPHVNDAFEQSCAAAVLPSEGERPEHEGEAGRVESCSKEDGGTTSGTDEITSSLLRSTLSELPAEKNSVDPMVPAQLDMIVEDIQKPGQGAVTLPGRESHDQLLVEMDENERLFQCFLYGLKKKLKKSDLPMLASHFYKNCVLACCPPGVSLEIKKTQFKKVTEFLTEMQKENFLTIKETAKGVHSIVEVNQMHEKVRHFRPWPLEQLDSDDGNAEFGYEPPQITELLAVNAQTLRLFSGIGLGKGDTLSLADLRSYVTEYVKANKLQHDSNKQYVLLNEVLTQVLVHGNEGFVEMMKWTDIFDRLTKKMSIVTQLTFSHGSVVTKKGPLLPIQIRVESRTANKKVTLISNLEPFAINVKQLAKDIKTEKACSTSVTVQSTGKQLLAQGNHAAFVLKLLKDRYRIPAKYIDAPC